MMNEYTALASQGEILWEYEKDIQAIKRFGMTSQANFTIQILVVLLFRKIHFL